MRELRLMSLDEQAKRSFDSGYNCAESVLLVVSKQPGITRLSVESFVPRVATGFGGGIARNGEICGALAGGIMAISLALGRDEPDESRDHCYRAVDGFYSDFLKAFGTCRCRELIGVDLRTPTGIEAYHSRIHYERCNPIVAWAVTRVQQIIRESLHRTER
jgi:C_GCAxxG_C_C family probable redox protein